MTIWSRAENYRAQIAGLTARLDAATAAHDRAVQARDSWEVEAEHLTTKLAAEIHHSGRLHRDLVELQDAVRCGEPVKRLTERLAQFSEQSVNSDLAVSDALADHAKHHECSRRVEPDAV